MTDILLIQPPVRDFYLTAKRTIPYGLATISSMLIHENFKVEIFDCLSTPKSKIIKTPPEMEYLKTFYGNEDISPFSLFHHYKHFGYSYEYLKKTIKDKAPFLIGISSLFTPYFNEALKCAIISKEAAPNCRVVMGGHHPTVLPESVMTSPAVDYCVRGEGEFAMARLATHLRDQKPLDDIPGIVFRKKDGRLHINPPAIVSDPEDFPFPATHLVKQSFYSRKKRRAISIMTSRGCPMKCSYCCMGKSSLPYRRRSVDTVIKEIEQELKGNPIGFIDFEDENLSLDKKWFMAFLTQMISKFGNLDMELRAMNGLFPPSLDEEIITTMKKAGFQTLNLSLGSMSPGQLKKFNRPDVRKAYEKVLEIANAKGLETVTYIIVGAPGQSAPESVEDILYFADKHTLAGVSVYYPAPGSPMYDEAKTEGILPDHFSLMRSSAIPIDGKTSRLESVTLLRLGRILNFIKHIEQLKIKVPLPAPFKGLEDLPETRSDRINTGLNILKYFFYDGIIRGVTSNGDIFEHKTALHLTERFIEGYKKVTSPPMHKPFPRTGAH